MDDKYFSGLEKQIRDSVQDAIDSMDFKNLNRKISDTVNEALDEARGHLMSGLHAVGKQSRGCYCGAKKQGGKPSEADADFESKDQNRQPEPSGSDEFRGRKTEAKGRKITEMPDSRLCKRGRVQAILLTILGGVGLGVVAILFLVVYLLAVAIKPLWGGVAGAFVFLAILTLGFVIALGAGIAAGKRLKRAELYLRQMGGRLYCDIEELARSIGRSRRYAARDLQRIIERGIFPQAHIDEQKTCLMLDEGTYLQYLGAQEALKQRELLFRGKNKQQEGRRRKAVSEEDIREKRAAGVQPHPDGLQIMMDQGQGYLKILQEANEAIPGEVISGKITRLAAVIQRILETVERKPEQKEEMGRFMEYYLPTTVKLVTAYRDFDRVNFEGDNIASAKREIEETMDTIHLAFERLLDDLYQSDAMEVAADASVLQTMLETDGFAKSDFNRRDEE